jgi:hypothetical protein
MRPSVKLAFVIGSGGAVAAVAGVSLGMALHRPWQDFDGAQAPGILFPAARAAERAPRTLTASDRPEDDPMQYAGYLPADPLPVTRPDGSPLDAVPAVQDAQREDADQALAEDSAAPPPVGAAGAMDTTPPGEPPPMQQASVQAGADPSVY